MAAAYRTHFADAGNETPATTQDSPSTTLLAGDTVYVLAVSTAGTSVVPSSVVWDPGVANQSLTKIAEGSHSGTIAYASVWRGQGLTAKTAAFRATWASSQDERQVSGWVGTGIDTTTPNGTVGTNTGAGTTASATATTAAGQLVVAFCHVFDGAPLTNTLDSPSGTERYDVQTTPTGYDVSACQDQTATGGSTAPQWTVNAALGFDTWFMFAVPLNDATGGIPANLMGRRLWINP